MLDDGDAGSCADCKTVGVRVFVGRVAPVEFERALAGLCDLRGAGRPLGAEEGVDGDCGAADALLRRGGPPELIEMKRGAAGVTGNISRTSISLSKDGKLPSLG